MAFDKTKFLKRFVEEAKEHVGMISKGLLTLEKNPADSETLNDVFRSAHTIKGSSKIMKLGTIAELAHRLEDALDAVRRGTVQFSDGMSEVFFSCIDTVEAMLDDVSSGRALPDFPEDLGLALENAAKGMLPKKEFKVLEGVVANPSSGRSENFEKQEPERSPEKHKHDETVRISGEKLDTLIKLMGEIVSGHARLKMRMIELVRIEKAARMAAGLSVNSVRDLSYDVTKFYSGINDDIITLEGLTGELQESSLKMRMFPVSIIFDNYKRLVRDQAKASGKKIDFSIKGDDTELDKKIIEGISDPLIHMIRNSVDHGLETPEKRVAAGKAPVGNLTLTAEYEGGNVLIRLKDDGGGISMDKIRETAVSKGIYTAQEINGISDGQLMDLIFTPGFSTTDAITDISGRGVGMDIVRENIVSELSGSIRVFTKEGRGTTLEIRLPLTLAVMHMMVIEVAGTIFAVPSSNVDEILRISRDELIDVVGKKAIRLREQIIPVVSMRRVLGISPGTGEKRNPLVLIVSVGKEKMGFTIDGLLREEIRTIKPLPDHMKNNPFVSGVTLSGNRLLDNVLNIPSIMEAAGSIKDTLTATPVFEENKEDINILVVDDSVSTREIEKSILESYGYNVTLAADGIEALENAEEFQYDLVITDIEMPRMDGLTLTQELKDRDGYREIPVILVSSRDKDEDKRKGLSVGADAYIVKDDFDQGSLIDIIRDLVGR